MFNLLNLRFSVLVGMVSELAAPQATRPADRPKEEATPRVKARELDKETRSAA